jgi:hypothetical protein
MIDAMIDLETLATEHDAIVTNIGVVLMDMKEKVVLHEQTYSMPLNWDEQFDKGRRCHPNTVRFWLQQSPEAIKGILAKPFCTNDAVLEGLVNFLPPGCGVWGNGADFDCAIMQSLYRTYGIRSPFSYSKHRCFRTLKNLSIIPAPERVGVHHNALDDAMFQAEWLMKIIRVGL